MEYSSEVRRRIESTARVGVRGADGAGRATGTAEDRSLNVWLVVQVELARETIASVRFEAYGCPHFIAAVDWIAERLEGGPVGELRRPLAHPAAAALGVPTEKLGKLLVIEDALAACFAARHSVEEQAGEDAIDKRIAG